MGIRAEKAGSVSRLRSLIKKGANSGGITRIKADADMTIRFLDEPSEWIKYSEHFDKTHGYYVCVDDGSCVGCLDGVRASSKFLANAVDMDTKEVVALVLPYSLADELAKRYDKPSWQTLTNRDLILSRTGSGMNDTSYSLDYEEPKRKDMSGYERLDLLGLLEATIPRDDDEEDEEEERPRGRRSEAMRGRASRDDDRRAPKSRPKPSTRGRSRDEDDEDDDLVPPRRSAVPKKASRPAVPRRVPKSSKGSDKPVSRGSAGLKKRRDDDRPGY